MTINCISCGHKSDIGDAYDNYEGPVKCWVCGTKLVIRTVNGAVRFMDEYQVIAQTHPAPQTTSGFVAADPLPAESLTSDAPPAPSAAPSPAASPTPSTAMSSSASVPTTSGDPT